MTLSDFVRSSKVTLEEIIIPTGVPGLSLIESSRKSNIYAAQRPGFVLNQLGSFLSR